MEKQKRKEEREKIKAEKQVLLNTKKMGELFDSTTKEDRMEIDRERANKQKMEEDIKKAEYYKKNRIKSGAELKKYKETKLSKNLKTELQIERTPAQRRRMVEAYRKTMTKIILESKLTIEKEKEYKELGKQEIKYITTKSTLLDYYNHLIILLRGESVLTWYTPCDPTKDKEPWLDTRLTDKWMPVKTSVQKKQLKKERQKSDIKILGEGPVEREKRRKKEKDEKIMRVLKDVRVTVYTCNARRLSNKMGVLASDAQSLKLDVIHISEAGVGPEKAMGLSGYTVLTLERSGPNRGSVMYVKNYLYNRILRIYDVNEEEEKSGAEIIQIQIDTVPKTSIYGMYLERKKSTHT